MDAQSDRVRQCQKAHCNHWPDTAAVHGRKLANDTQTSYIPIAACNSAIYPQLCSRRPARRGAGVHMPGEAGPSGMNYYMQPGLNQQVRCVISKVDVNASARLQPACR